ncbi:hypothetical protein K435DRAFT_777226 [Dendrothele bispora CBS 962.96]|uniref:Uncharacterized protein n=1 Tax=Dendrothele bispora (strain CBS 962.96) TaxID=1314807 RepID=A0A4S8M951_DENBC|nr:hypothetical protein K435DRAFT_777226 [Dendrothele bispora CBS 962.96]
MYHNPNPKLGYIASNTPSITLFHFIFMFSARPVIKRVPTCTYISPILPGTPKTKTASKSPNNTSCKLKQKRLPQLQTGPWPVKYTT